MNNKAQFFIFAAVLVIFSLFVIQYSLLSSKQISQTLEDVPFSDIPFIASYIESSVRQTSTNSFENIYSTGDLTKVHRAFSNIYSAHYEIEEKELNYYLSELEVGNEIVKASNIDFYHNILVTGPSVFEVGNFNRKVLIDITKIQDTPKVYLMQSDIGQFRVETLTGANPGFLNPYVVKIDLNKNSIYDKNEILLRESNYSSESRIIYDNKAYTIGESRITYGGITNNESRASFIDTYYLFLGNDGKNYIQLRDSTDKIISIDGVSKFYENDIFLFNDYLIKINEIKYSINGQKDDYVKYVIMNIQISLQETERRREWFDPVEDPGLRFGAVGLKVQKQNSLSSSQINNGDKVIISTLVHNDLEGPITDKDLNNSKNLGSRLNIWEVLKIYLAGEEGVFYSDNSRYKFKIDSANDRILGIYEGNDEILVDIKRCDRDILGDLICVTAYPIEEGFEFELGGEEYIVNDISSTTVSFLRKNSTKLDVRIDVDENLLSSEAYKYDYGKFNLGGSVYRIYPKKNLSGYVDSTSIIIDPPLGNDIPLNVGDPVILNNYLVIFDSTSFQGYDEKWHVILRYFDTGPDMKKFPVGQTRLFYGWYDGYKVVNTWKYDYDPLDQKIIINSTSPIDIYESNSTFITPEGILISIPLFDSENFYEYDIYYPAHGQKLWLGEMLCELDINSFRQHVRIKYDENKNGVIDPEEGYITIDGNNKLAPNQIFYAGGVGFEIVSIIPFHDDGDAQVIAPDEVDRVLLKKVPYYQYTPILERMGKSNIEEFTTILSVYDYYVRRPGDYLVIFSYSFEIDGIKKETSQYYNFKVYQ